jgi:endonuclease/exonuclease/phosphatase family metal-dependent hydrolase
MGNPTVWNGALLSSIRAAALIFLVFESITSGFAKDRDVVVMTRNLYQGTNFQEVLAAPNPGAFVAAVSLTYQNILDTKPIERAAAVALEIQRERPDLVGLQEASILRKGAGIPTTVVVDQLDSLLSELADLGDPYNVIAIVPGIDVTAPSTLGFNVRLTLRTVIIARAESENEGGIDLSNVQVQNYATNLQFPTAVGPILNLRGWASVDVEIGTSAFRFITTHLEAGQVPAVQLAQAAEAIHSAVNSTTLPIVFLGDFNATGDSGQDPTFPTYQSLINAGLADAWPPKHGRATGLTCCQDADLLNTTSKLFQRVDLILLRGKIGVRDIHLIGNTPAVGEPFGLWPSDHAGVVATLKIFKLK